MCSYHQLPTINSPSLPSTTTSSLSSTHHPYHQLPPSCVQLPDNSLPSTHHLYTINSHPPVCNYQATPYHQLTISIPSTPTLLCATTTKPLTFLCASSSSFLIRSSSAFRRSIPTPAEVCGIQGHVAYTCRGMQHTPAEVCCSIHLQRCVAYTAEVCSIHLQRCVAYKSM